MAIINYIEKHLKTFNVKPHLHVYWEIIFLTEGEGFIETKENPNLHYSKGEIICIPPKLKHSNNSSIGFENIHFTLEDWSPFINKPFIINNSSSVNDFYTLLNLTYQYFHKLPANHPINLALTETIFSFLNLLISQSSNANVTQNLVNEIINHYTEKTFNLEESYNAVPLSKEYLRKIFIKEHGVSPSKFLLQKRLTLAKQLLSKKENGYLRINEISETCGFSDHAYFCRVFKKETGLSPSKFQLELLKNNKIY